MAIDPTQPLDECPDCEEVLLARQGMGPCPKCSKLREHLRGSAEYNDILVRAPSQLSSLQHTDQSEHLNLLI